MKTYKELENMSAEEIAALSEEERILAESILRNAIKTHFLNPFGTYQNCPFKMSQEQYNDLKQEYAPLRLLGEQAALKRNRKRN